MNSKQLNDSIYLMNPDSNWKNLATSEIDIISNLLQDHINSIEHIGSTAIPNIKAKHVIDIMAGVATLEDARTCISILENFGYTNGKTEFVHSILRKAGYEFKK
tara:strand:+ start:1902 stop:2213 length:312 start_codon:yes stop_codon:yes gene_type:complete